MVSLSVLCPPSHQTLWLFFFRSWRQPPENVSPLVVAVVAALRCFRTIWTRRQTTTWDRWRRPSSRCPWPTSAVASAAAAALAWEHLLEGRAEQQWAQAVLTTKWDVCRPSVVTSVMRFRDCARTTANCVSVTYLLTYLLAYLFLLRTVLCTTCYTSVAVNHILMECPQFNHLRLQYRFGSTLKDLFNNTSVDDIIAFIKDTHFYTRI